jgi:hypothetical protein
MFYTFPEVHVLIAYWRVFYNTVRPRSSLGYKPPAPEPVLPNQEITMQEKTALANIQPGPVDAGMSVSCAHTQG